MRFYEVYSTGSSKQLYIFEKKTVSLFQVTHIFVVQKKNDIMIGLVIPPT